jgi:hypothetical protein
MSPSKREPIGLASVVEERNVELEMAMETQLESARIVSAGLYAVANALEKLVKLAEAEHKK